MASKTRVWSRRHKSGETQRYPKSWNAVQFGVGIQAKPRHGAETRLSDAHTEARNKLRAAWLPWASSTRSSRAIPRFRVSFLRAIIAGSRLVFWHGGRALADDQIKREPLRIQVFLIPGLRALLRAMI